MSSSGQAGFVPFSAHSDLAAARGAELLPSPAGFDLVIRGGDAATGYTATLTFEVLGATKTAFLTSRTVRSNSNPARRDHFEYEFPPMDANY